MWVLEDITKKIINAIVEKERFTERELKKKLKIEDNEIRKILYRLHELGIVYPIKSIIIKENKFDYEWGLKIKDIEKIYKIIVDHEKKKLEEELNKLPDTVYVCEECGLSFDFDQAEEIDFKCPECGRILMPKPNLKKIEVKELIEKLNKLLEEVKVLKVTQ